MLRQLKYILKNFTLILENQNNENERSLNIVHSIYLSRAFNFLRIKTPWYIIGEGAFRINHPKYHDPELHMKTLARLRESMLDLSVVHHGHMTSSKVLPVQFSSFMAGQMEWKRGARQDWAVTCTCRPCCSLSFARVSHKALFTCSSSGIFCSKTW